MTTKTKIRKIQAIVTAILVLSPSFIVPIQIKANEKYYIETLKSRLKNRFNNWEVFLDPGPGGGSGGYTPDPPLFYYKTLLSFNPYPYDGDRQTADTEESYSSWLWNIYQSSGYISRNEFLQAIRDADEETSEKLAISYVGHGNVISGQSVLILPSGNTITYDDLYKLSKERDYWHLKFVLMTGCYTMFTTHLSDGFARLGAEVVIGGAEEASVDAAAVVADVFYYYVLDEHYSVEEAFTQTELEYEESKHYAEEFKDDVWNNVFSDSELEFLSSLDSDFWGTVTNVGNYLQDLNQTLFWNPLVAILIILILLGALILPYINISIPFPYEMRDLDTTKLTYI